MLTNQWHERRFDNRTVREGDHRTPFQRDKARILHSAAFRRLQSKTQVLGIGIGDFYRTRLTHSLEASQIGQGISAQLTLKYPDLMQELGLDSTLIEALCLAHDIGHPPFGHGGEVALNFMMHQHGGFEGNGQTFRIVTRLEPYTAEHGMDLSRRTLLGLVKYPNTIDALQGEYPREKIQDFRQVKAGQWHPPKGLFLDDIHALEWLLSPLSKTDRELFQQTLSTRPGAHKKNRFKSFDCSIMELADDIAYSIHDLEDAIVMGIVNQTTFEQELLGPIQAIKDATWLNNHLPRLSPLLFSEHPHERKNAIGALVNAFITSIEVCATDPGFEEPLLKYNATFPEQFERALSVFKTFVYQRVIRKSEIQQLEYKGQLVVMELFNAFSSDPERLLPENTQKRWHKARERGSEIRVIADYISGMTDEFASRMHGNLFLPKIQGINHGQFY
ncbi:anti-phage deoxyguanosine triphosphatase [Planctobacterium marinum]|uniref:Deoxyguanosinetriphosphate triphosphohydrolase-like protein n=1 Tax=Planctobacterium marinum TaxID=1631968 RepID=A0AA48KQR4_9ALTE|nr:deoxyguanosinetriphosphate triphosphohydrolase-like protein [Planctobacterium marinum]